jgi:hypothetical protein
MHVYKSVTRFFIHKQEGYNITFKPLHCEFCLVTISRCMNIKTHHDLIKMLYKLPSPISSSCYYHPHSPIIVNLTSETPTSYLVDATLSKDSQQLAIPPNCSSFKILAYLNVNENLTRCVTLIPKRNNKTMQHHK